MCVGQGEVFIGCVVYPYRSALGNTGIIHPSLPLATIHETADSSDSVVEQLPTLPLATIQESANSSSDSVIESRRPTTPLEPSERGPLHSVSRGGGTSRWSGYGEEGRGHGHRSEMDLLNESALDSKHQLLHTEDK